MPTNNNMVRPVRLPNVTVSSQGFSPCHVTIVTLNAIGSLLLC